jgi:glutathione reductase (NADPH)
MRQYEGDIDIYISRFTPLKHTISKRRSKAMMKLVVQRSTQRVLGCHMVGDDAPEIVQGLAIAVTCKATKADFDRTIGIHPTAGRSLFSLAHFVSSVSFLNTAEEFVTMRTKRE